MVKSNKAFTYIVHCVSGEYYTGYTTDIERRLFEHNSSNKGAKYTRYRRPVKLVYCKEFNSKSEAMKHESYIKSLPRNKKIELINEYMEKCGK